MSHILLLDNSPDTINCARRILQDGGHQVRTCSSFQSGVEEARMLPIGSIIVAAYRIGDHCVSSYVRDLRDSNIHHPVIAYAHVMNGGDVRDALSESKIVDFLQPQVFHETLLPTVDKYQIPDKLADMHQTMYQQKGDAAEELHRQIDSISQLGENTLIVSGIGTGKGRVAVSLHKKSNYNGKPLVVLEHHDVETRRMCNEACPLCIIKEKFIEAHGGTLIIKNLHLFCKKGQRMILAMINDPALDVHIIATATDAIYAIVESGEFEMELLSKIATTKIPIGEFRENPENFVWLATSILAQFCAKHQRPDITISPVVFKMFAAYPFPGNEAEFETIILQCAAICTGNYIGYEIMPDKIKSAYEKSLAENPIDLKDPKVIQHAMDNTPTLEEAAIYLGICAKTLYTIRLQMKDSLKKPNRKKAKSQKKLLILQSN